MLALTLSLNESIIIGSNILVTLNEIQNRYGFLGVSVPKTANGKKIISVMHKNEFDRSRSDLPSLRPKRKITPSFSEAALCLDSTEIPLELGESLMIGDQIEIFLTKVDGTTRVTLGTQAPRHIPVMRMEIDRQEHKFTEASERSPAPLMA